jgi:hypothetical protein
MPIVHVYMWSGVSREAKEKIIKGITKGIRGAWNTRARSGSSNTRSTQGKLGSRGRAGQREVQGDKDAVA